MPELYSCEVISNEKITEHAFALTVSAEHLPADSQAGQFVHVKCGHSRLLRRPISICKADGDTITMVYETRGEGTMWLSKRKPEQRLSILGPLGNGYSLPDTDIIVAGGGIGVPPLLFAAKSAKKRVTAVLGFRDLSRLMLINEFEEICEEAYITTDDGSAGIHGSIIKPLSQLISESSEETVLACGPRGMLSAVAELCADFKVPCQVSLEERMGCGVGACLVCACRTVRSGDEFMERVCKDGPVFNAREVVWNG